MELEFGENFNLNNCCRVCLQERVELFAIFADGAAIAEILNKCTRYKVKLQDGLPQHICACCMEQAYNAYAFKQLAESAYHKFMALLHKQLAEEHFKEQATQTVAENSTDSSVTAKENLIEFDGKACQYEQQQICNANDDIEIDLKKHGSKLSNEHYDTEIINPIANNATTACVINAFNLNIENAATQMKEETAADTQKEACAANQLLEVENNEQSLNKETKKTMDGTLAESVKSSCKTAKSLVRQKHTLAAIQTNDANEKRKQAKPTSNNAIETPSPCTANRCEICQRTFSRLCHLRRHMLTHFNERLHSCEQCAKTFLRSDHLKAHIVNVHETKVYKCAECERAFARENDLKRHQELRHNADPNALKIYKCDYCSKKFSTTTYLRRHKVLHEQRSFLCSICGDSFARYDYLAVHMTRHTGEKPFKCQYCGKGFPRANDVKMHERYHTDNKPHICDLCGKGFHRTNKLKIHMRIHTGERPYKCNQCDKTFPQSKDLKTHMRLHTGERFRCMECDASFLQLYLLRQHALNVHGTLIEASTGRLEKFPPKQLTQQELLQ